MDLSGKLGTLSYKTNEFTALKSQYLDSSVSFDILRLLLKIHFIWHSQAQPHCKLYLIQQTVGVFTVYTQGRGHMGGKGSSCHPWYQPGHPFWEVYYRLAVHEELMSSYWYCSIVFIWENPVHVFETTEQLWSQYNVINLAFILHKKPTWTLCIDHLGGADKVDSHSVCSCPYANTQFTVFKCVGFFFFFFDCCWCPQLICLKVYIILKVTDCSCRHHSFISWTHKFS